MTGHVATAEIDIQAPPSAVWAALTEPEAVKQAMFGAEVDTDWTPGSPITWTGEFQGRPFQDKGQILAVEPHRRLSMTHWSPMSGTADEPSNHHTLVYQLAERGGGTHLTLEQDNNASAEEAEHSAQQWSTMLEVIKRVAEERA
ncbi:SRPBCC family protein [Nakamurella leprariae]|uniref:SRPBCC domain-containing protein n=1 Tax=Nakamurella leprariae TaxID=2803911 RepID=A0A939C324_9ACTN|nr:SRPBCC family protein [Nakamurella leprariae]MBM9468939.1 SRPBCC domain-containing protein [Nakamurella leprariae]